MPGGELVGRRHVLIGGLCAAASGLAYARQPQAHRSRLAAGTLDSWMPETVGDWSLATHSGVVLPPSDALSQRLYDNVVTRIYTSPSQQPVMLLIAYSNVQDGLLQIHRPEFCYTAAGFQLTPTRPATVTDARGNARGANMFVASGPDRTEQVLYWTRIGTQFPQSWVQQRMAVIEANLRREVPDGLLARVSSVIPSAVADVRPLNAFAAALDRAASPPLRAILFGAT